MQIRARRPILNATSLLLLLGVVTIVLFSRFARAA